jgi:hypothetical protein
MDDNYWRKESDADRVSERNFENDLSLPNDLPPVEPPSAGLIVQLFLVPAVIVGVIVGVYALFGKMASRELDWRQLTVDVRSENPHIRWRGALGLAQMLDANAHRASNTQDVTTNPEIAAALSELYGKLISLANPSDEELKQIEFLSKALGRMQVADVVRPALEAGIAPGLERDIRKHSLIGLAMLAGTLRDHGKTLDDPGLVNELIEISREPEPLFRHQAAYVLGLIPTPASLERLEVLLEDPDQMVRVNAAIAFARNSKTAGIPVFHALLQEAADWKLDPSAVATPEEEASYFERTLMVLNAIKAISQLKPDLSETDRARFAEQLDAVSHSTKDAVLRTDALKAMHDLKAT